MKSLHECVRQAELQRVPARRLFLTLAALPIVMSVQDAHGASGPKFSIPEVLSGFELQSVIDNEQTNPGLGETLLYAASGIRLAVYIYDGGEHNLPEGSESAAALQEFSRAKSDITRLHGDAVLIPQQGDTKRPMALHAMFRFRDEVGSWAGDVMSHLYLTCSHRKFIKIRATYPSGPDSALQVQVQNFADKFLTAVSVAPR